jgi:hypothetical protein
VPTWLSEEWFEAAAPLTSSLPPVDTFSGTVDLAVVTAPRRESHLHWTYRDGEPGEGAPGPAADVDLGLSVSAADAVRLVDGSVEPSVAFMRGRLKGTGDGGLLLAFLASTTRPEFEVWRRRVESLGRPGTDEAK